MDYPFELLPKNGYKIINCDLSDYYLLRIINLKEGDEPFLEKPSSILDSETGHLNYEYICTPAENIIDYSTSLAGIYNNSHITIILTPKGIDKFLKTWEIGKEIDLPIYDEEFNHNKLRLAFYLKISDLNNYEFEYEVGQGEEKKIVKCKCLVSHTPYDWNYWHFSLHWDVDNVIYKTKAELPRKQRQKIGHAARTHISTVLLFPEIPVPIPELPAEHYNN